MSRKANKKLFSKIRLEDTGRQNQADDYIVKKSKRSDIVLRIFSVLFAVAIWAYVVSADAATHTFEKLSVNLLHTEIAEELGYAVEYETTFLSCTVKGRIAKISTLKEDAVSAYVDLSLVDFSDVIADKTFVLPISFSVPSGITLTEQSEKTVEVRIYKPSNE